MSDDIGDIGFPGLLFIVFLVLKLTGVIAWSWWWVTAPLWGPFAIAAIVVFTITLFAAFSSVIVWLKDR